MAELIQQTIAEIDRSPGLIIEVEDDPSNWLQIIPQVSDANDEGVWGFALNFPYRGGVEPTQPVGEAGIHLPPKTRLVSWEAGIHATFWIRSDIPLIALALLAGDLLQKLGGAQPGFELNVQIEYGF